MFQEFHLISIGMNKNGEICINKFPANTVFDVTVDISISRWSILADKLVAVYVYEAQRKLLPLNQVSEMQKIALLKTNGFYVYLA